MKESKEIARHGVRPRFKPARNGNHRLNKIADADINLQ